MWFVFGRDELLRLGATLRSLLTGSLSPSWTAVSSPAKTRIIDVRGSNLVKYFEERATHTSA